MPVLIAAYLLLGYALLVADGMLPGLPYALGAVALVLVAPKRWWQPSPRLMPFWVALAAALVLKRTPAYGWVDTAVIVLTVLQALIAIAACVRPRLATRGAMAAALGIYATTGALLITCSPPPRIDVLELQQDGARALVEGRNPYAVTYANLYTPEETQRFFGDQRTELREYPYPPASLLVTTMARLVGGDVRWAFLGAQLGVAALLFALAREAGHGAGAALALATIHLLHPRGLFLLERAWTEPLLAGSFLVVILLVVQRRIRWLGVALGLFVGVKQYSVLALPLLFRDGRIPRRAWLEALGVAIALALPFLVWSPHDLVNDVVLFQLRQPFRADALSIPAYLASVAGWRAPSVLALAGAGAALALEWRQVGPTAPPSRLPLAVAVVYAAFFLLAKQAFCNYYYFVGVLFLAAAALVRPAPAGSASDAAAKSQVAPSR